MRRAHRQVLPAAAEPGPRSLTGVSFDHLPARYDRITTLLSDDLRAWLLFHLPARGDRAVDLGCGTGIWTSLLAERYREVLAVDRSAPMLESARRRRRPNTVYQQRDLRSVEPGQDGRFDLVFCAHTLRYLPDPADALRRMRTLLRPGGLLVLIDADWGPGAGFTPNGQPAAVSGRRLRAEALRTFRDGLWRRRRPLPEALELLRLQLDPDWLNHQIAYPPFTASQWDSLSRALLPGAVTTPLHRTRTLLWTPTEPPR